MIDKFDSLLSDCFEAFSCLRSWEKGRDLAYGILNCLGRQTVTGMLTGCGKQFWDWSSYYRLFTKSRIDVDELFRIICKKGVEQRKDKNLIVAHMDDTLLRKSGRKIPGTGWRRDPLGPPFHTNFIWGQRFIQMSLALPCKKGICQARSIPIDFHHCPTAKKPGKNATEEQLNQYREDTKRLKLSKQGAERIIQLRENLDSQGFESCKLVVSVDGSYTNKEVLKNIPHNTSLIGRIRKDTKLYEQAKGQPHTGRKKVYGQQLPNPEQIRQSDHYQWQSIRAWAAGKEHDFDIKVIDNIMWRSAGQHHKLRLIVIRPLAYRLTKGSSLLYRSPAYLISTDLSLDLQTTLQSYLWRWEIEVNFREQKTLMGCGQAQVRNKEAIERIPGFIAAVYSLLHLAGYQSEKEPKLPVLPRPKWYKKQNQKRITTGDLINNIRAQAYSKAVGFSFSSFVKMQNIRQSRRNSSNNLLSPSFYMRN